MVPDRNMDTLTYRHLSSHTQPWVPNKTNVTQYAHTHKKKEKKIIHTYKESQTHIKWMGTTVCGHKHVRVCVGGGWR